MRRPNFTCILQHSILLKASRELTRYLLGYYGKTAQAAPTHRRLSKPSAETRLSVFIRPGVYPSIADTSTWGNPAVTAVYHFSRAIFADLVDGSFKNAAERYSISSIWKWSTLAQFRYSFEILKNLKQLLLH